MNAILVLHAGRGGGTGAWVLETVAGLPLALRAVLTLASGGVERVALACGTAEAAAIRPQLETWRRRRGAPEINVVEGDAGRPSAENGAVIVVDGRFFFTADHIRRALQKPPQLSEPQGSRVPGLHGGGCAAPPSVPLDEAIEGPAFDLTTPAGRREAERRLLAGLRKSTDGWCARHLNRPVSLWLSRRLAALPLSPNFYTVVTLAVGMAAGVVSAFGGYWNLLAGGALFQAASMLDGVDGEIARLTFQCSPAGEALDSICDDLANVMYLTGLTLGVYGDTGLLAVLLLGATAVGLDVLTRLVLYATLARKGLPVTLVEYESRLKGLGPHATRLERLARLLAPLAKRDLQAWLAFAFAAAGAAWLTLVFWAAGAIVGAPVVLTRVRRLASGRHTAPP